MTRFGYVMLTYFVPIGIAIAPVIPMPTKLIWNATASAPTNADALEVPELVAVVPPEPLAAVMAERGYIARGVSRRPEDHGGRDRDRRGAGARPDWPQPARLAGLPHHRRQAPSSAGRSRSGPTKRATATTNGAPTH